MSSFAALPPEDGPRTGRVSRRQICQKRTGARREKPLPLSAARIGSSQILRPPEDARRALRETSREEPGASRTREKGWATRCGHQLSPGSGRERGPSRSSSGEFGPRCEPGPARAVQPPQRRGRPHFTDGQTEGRVRTAPRAPTAAPARPLWTLRARSGQLSPSPALPIQGPSLLSRNRFPDAPRERRRRG